MTPPFPPRRSAVRAGRHYFEPTTESRGVGQHPHRGFETVTVGYDGQVEHKDSAGNGGIIGPGDVQWMTAGGGILHEEYHAPAFAKTGGPFRMENGRASCRERRCQSG